MYSQFVQEEKAVQYAKWDLYGSPEIKREESKEKEGRREGNKIKKKKGREKEIERGGGERGERKYQFKVQFENDQK